MNIKLTPEQIDKLREDKYLNIDIGNGVGLYFNRKSIHVEAVRRFREDFNSRCV